MCVGFAQFYLNYKDKKKLANPFSTTPDDDLYKSIEAINPKNLRINLWNQAIIIPQEDPSYAELAQCAWVEQKKGGGTWPVFNVRVEGGWGNKSNDPEYKGPYGIFKNPYVKDLIMTQRCIIPCDFFIEQPTDKKIKKKFIIKKEDGSPIHMGGVYNQVANEDTGEVKLFFAIKTTAYSKITIKAEHHRSPIIIPDDDIFDYLNPQLTSKELEKFYSPPNSDGYIAYEVDPIIGKRNCPLEKDDTKLMEPIGEIMKVEI